MKTRRIGLIAVALAIVAAFGHWAWVKKPSNGKAHYGLGVALAKKGQVDEAIRQFHEAARQGYLQPPEEIRRIQDALRLKPGYTDARESINRNALQ